MPHFEGDDRLVVDRAESAGNSVRVGLVKVFGQVTWAVRYPSTLRGPCVRRMVSCNSGNDERTQIISTSFAASISPGL